MCVRSDFLVRESTLFFVKSSYENVFILLWSDVETIFVVFDIIPTWVDSLLRKEFIANYIVCLW